MDAGYTVDYSVHEEQVKLNTFVEFYCSRKISLRLMKTMIPLSSSLALVEEWWESSMSMGLGQEMGRVTICKMTWPSVMTVKMRRQMVMMIPWHSEEKKYLYEHIVFVKYRT